MKSVVLLSGGLDSAVVLAEALSLGAEVCALSVDYKQQHSRELACARELAAHFAVDHRVVSVSFPWETPLTSGVVPPSSVAGHQSGALVPGRNAILVSLGVALAQRLGAESVLLGSTAEDVAGFSDCRPEWIKAASAAAEIGYGVRVLAPLALCTKAAVVRKALNYGVPLAYTSSCYLGTACGECEACKVRRRGFLGCGATDPLRP